MAQNGGTARLGRLLAPMAVRYIVVPTQTAPRRLGAAPPGIPPGLTRALGSQLDLRLLPADASLAVYENTAWGPGRALVPGAVARPPAGSPTELGGGADLAGGQAILPGDGPVRFRGPSRTRAPSCWPRARRRGGRSRSADGAPTAPTPSAWPTPSTSSAPGDGRLRYNTPFLRYGLVLVQLALWVGLRPVPGDHPRRGGRPPPGRRAGPVSTATPGQRAADGSRRLPALARHRPDPGRRGRHRPVGALARPTPCPTTRASEIALSGPTAAPASARSSAWYCTGATGAPDAVADGTVVIANAGDRALRADITVIPIAGDPGQTVARGGRPTAGPPLRLADVVQAAHLSAVVELDGGEAVVELTTTGPLGASVTPCASSASPTWYFAEGVTTRDATEVLLVLNPFPEDAVVDFAFTTEEGQVTPQALTGLAVRGRGMTAINVGEFVQRRESVAARITARTGRLVVSRLQVFDGSVGRKGVSVALGVPAPGAGVVLRRRPGRRRADRALPGLQPAPGRGPGGAGHRPRRRRGRAAADHRAPGVEGERGGQRGEPDPQGRGPRRHRAQHQRGRRGGRAQHRLRRGRRPVGGGLVARRPGPGPGLGVRRRPGRRVRRRVPGRVQPRLDRRPRSRWSVLADGTRREIPALRSLEVPAGGRAVVRMADHVARPRARPCRCW